MDYLYIIGDGIGSKIGVTDNPEYRRKSLQCGSSRPLHFEMLIPLPVGVDRSHIEGNIHSRYDNKRLKGGGHEWFALTASDISDIAAITIRLLVPGVAAANVPELRDQLPVLPAMVELQQGKIAYTKIEVMKMLGLSQVTLWRLEKRGCLMPVPHVRHKIYSLAELKRFLEKAAAA